MSELAVRVAAQAKLNLHLRVFPRDESGYHPLETIFHRIDLADDLVVEITSGTRTLDVAGTGTGPVESNLAWRAASAYAEHNRWPGGFNIALTKRIPVGAGLGGGSADAAAVLRALNSLSPSPMPAPRLLALGGTMGSDIPFLLSDAAMALAWSRGERMLSLPPLPRHDLLLMTPEFSVTTADAYRWLDEDRARGSDGRESMGEQPPGGEAIAFDLLDLSSWARIAKFARNDFEPVVAARHPELSSYLARLRSSRATLAGMTGSGSTLFGVLDTPPDYSKVPEEHRARVTTTTTSIDVVQPVRVG